jgi:HK97 gp10 family phage protein
VKRLKVWAEMKTEMRLTGVDNVLNLLRQLPAEVVSKRGGPVKSALRKAALVIQRQAAANLQAATAGSAESTGLLLKNLIVSRGKAPSTGKGERYLVRVRRKSYNRAAERSAEGRKAKKAVAVTTVKTGQLLEYGSSHQRAEPWLRPAFQAKAAEAINTATSELVAGLDRIVKRLSKGGA